ncbi:MAG: hypothetical protein CMF19_03875 [Idiomarinaceae bacterium]|nr:hypothetical protein [Idiomarinaceae bacterium]
MAYFKRDRFSGIAPGVAPNLLAEQFAQIAENIDFESGSIAPIRNPSSSVETVGGSTQSIYYYENSVQNVWLAFDDPLVNVVEGPIPGDTYERLYWTGDGAFPKMSVQTRIYGDGTAPFPENFWRLGVPAPDSTPSVSIANTLDDTVTPDDVSYVYTFVTAYGEEGPPSEPSTVSEFTPSTQTATIQLPAYGGTSTYINFARKRIYRSNTGSTNTTFQLVDDVPYATPSITDNRAGSELQEVLPSETWIGPPDDDTTLYPDGPLLGLTPVANGIFAGFTGKRLCLSEPYLPHAWPISYRITLEEDIVGIGTTANGVVCLTNGKPYFVTGVDPSAMTALQVDLAQACVNRASIVDMGEYILYAGPDGLCAVSGTEGRVVTKGLISPEQWNADFSPTTIKAFRHEGKYIAFYNLGSAPYASTDYRGWVFDPRADEAAISTITSDRQVYGGWNNPKTGELSFIDALSSTSTSRDIKIWEGSVGSGSDKRRPATWKSKKVVFPAPTSISWVYVLADNYPQPISGNPINYDYVLRIKVWADGTLLADYHLSSDNPHDLKINTPASLTSSQVAEPVMRLPAKQAREWEVQVQTHKPVREICLAQTLDELKAT